ncbi:MAG: saccharopine dehydrogenase NADP-binding domain-containing protein [Sneathiella sp.]|nr:saccharopine dehydrogenase NADP-binding domain-containing protein [Sneathiella sp.]
MSIMIYGASGYTGQLVCQYLKESGLPITLAGRSKSTMAAIAADTGFPCVELPLSDADNLRAALKNIDVVLHCAGPFSATAKPMIDACIASKTHYLDITGEIDVFEAAAARDEEAKSANIMVMPGVGFDVVPSDCLAAHIKKRLPDATELLIAIKGLDKPSRGTAKTAIEGLKSGTKGRRDGKILCIDPVDVLSVDFEGTSVECLPISWGDVSTAWHSTKIADITVAFEASPQIRKMVAMPRVIRWVLSTDLGQSLLKKMIDKGKPGPNQKQRDAGQADLLAIAKNAAGVEVRSRLKTPEGYALTQLTASEILKQVHAGKFTPGFQTPSRVFGPDFILGFKNCERTDVN